MEKVDIEPEIWTGCYREGWQKGRDLVPDAFKHPAKASKSLVMRIVRTGLERGWWRAGDTLVDPFGGVGTTGIVAAYSGLAVVCVELEPTFCRLMAGYECPGYGKGGTKHAGLCPECQGSAAESVTAHHFTGNFEIHRAKWAALGVAQPVIVQGDSRRLRAVLAGADSCLSSPPYAANDQRGGHTAVAAQKRVATDGYGSAEGQIGNDSGETYWKAVSLIYQEVFALLRPGGHIALIVKDYVRQKQRQPLCDRTWTLLQHVGFVPVTRVYAMLGRKWTEKMLTGETVEREKSRKSFFRRLAERKGSPKIDFEEVLVMRKPQAQEPQAAAPLLGTGL
jgi:hypothetical protein